MTAKLIVIGLTGSIGAGKSSVTRIWGENGAHVISADQLAREVVEPGSSALNEIRSQFGDIYITHEGELDRKKLAELIFTNEDQRKRLEAILHPRINAIFKTRLKQAQSSGESLVVYEVPLLFESKQDFPELTCRVTVSAPLHLCISRIMARDNLTSHQAEARLASQLDQKVKESRADYVILNDCTFEELKQRVIKLDEEIRQKYFT